VNETDHGTNAVEIPILRAGEPYYSINKTELTDVRTGEVVARVSQANPGLISRDMRDLPKHQAELQALSGAELVDICRRAGELFLNGEVPLGDKMQSADDYVKQLAATSGMPESLCRGNMAKIHFVLAEMETVHSGLSRGLDLDVLDRGWGIEAGRCVSYLRQTDSMGVILPSNSPGVHSLWIPSIPLKVPLVLKPGAREPWTPMRIAQALIAAGCPKGAIGFYPTSHGGAAEILLRTGRSMMFGDKKTVAGWATDDRVQLHGPGWSKVLLGDDEAPRWREHLDLMATSIAANGGRSCINASGVWVSQNGREIAEALAEKLAAIDARTLDDPTAGLAAFSDPRTAHAISELIDRHLKSGGAEDLTAKYREGGRVAELDGCTFLLPTLIWCDSVDHPLAQLELLFPYASIVEVPQDEILRQMEPSLVVSAITEDPTWSGSLMAAPQIERLNLGRIPTSAVSWDQPHEGNLFTHLYRQRAFQAPESLAASEAAAPAAPAQ